MKIWASANQKGGVGKTTTVVTLAGHLINRGNTVLLVDLDPHGSMTGYFGNDADSLEYSVYHLFQEQGVDPSIDSGVPIHDIILSTSIEGLKLLPASMALATLDRQLGNQEGKGLVLQRTLQGLQNEFDYTLIDCPPLLGISMVNALAACEHLLLPVQTEFLALKGLERMMHTLQMVMQARKQQLDYTIIPTMFDRRTRASVQSLSQLREQYGEQLFDSVVPIDTQFREASQRGIPLSIMQPKSRGSLAYSALLNSLLGASGEGDLQLVSAHGQ